MKLTKDLLLEMIKKEMSEYSKRRAQTHKERPKIETAQNLIIHSETYPIERKMVNMGDYDAMELYITKGGQKLKLGIHGQQGKVMRFATNIEGEKVDLIPASPNNLSDREYSHLVYLK